MLAIAVQRVTRMQLGGGRERCPYVGRRIEAPALVGVRRAELEGEAERARARWFVRVVLAVVAAPAARAAAASPAPSRPRQCHPAQWCTCPRRSTHLPPRASSARARATCSSRGRIHLYGAELIRVVPHTSSWPPIRKILPPTGSALHADIVPHYNSTPTSTTFPHCKLSPAYQRFGCSFLRRLFNLVPPCNMLWLVLLASHSSLADDSPTPLAKALSLQGCLRRSDATCVLTPPRGNQAAS